LEQYNTTFYKELVNDFHETLMKVADMVNVPRETMDMWKLHDIYDVFQNDIYAGKALPQDFEIYHKNMSYLYDTLVYLVDFGSVKQKRVLSTPFFQKVIGLLEAKVSGNENKKWIMYSAHDITLVMILAGLNYTSYECVAQGWKQGGNYDKLCQHFPTYASNLLIELHNNSNTFSVKIRYNGEYLMEYDYHDFISKLKGSVVDDFLNICNDTVKFTLNDKQSDEGGSMGGWGWFFFGLVIGIAGSVLAAFFLYKKYIRPGRDLLPFTAEMEVIQNK